MNGERFERKLVIDPDSLCWNWTGSVSKAANGAYYGHLHYEGKLQLAHRVAYQQFQGEIPANSLVLHKCNNPLCCNPEHLELGDYKRNAQYRADCGRGNTKLSLEQARYIRASSKTQRELSKEFDVHFRVVQRVLKNETHRE